MKNFEDAVPLIVGFFVAVILLFGFLTVIRKTLKYSSPQYNTIDTQSMLQEQRWRMEAMEQRQKDLLREQKQRTSDLQRQQKDFIRDQQQRLRDLQK